MVFVGVVVCLYGVRLAILGEAESDVLVGMVLGLGLAMLCVADSRVVGKPAPATTPLIILVLWPLAFPVYLWWSRGFQRGSLLFLAGVTACLVLAFGSFFIAWHLTWGSEF